MISNSINKYTYFLIAICSALVFISFIGNCPLFDWDEINFAECAREMLVSKNYSHVQLYYRPFWEKPPLFIWFQALSMNVFGVNEFAARFPNALCGIVTLLTLYWFGKKVYSPKFGILWCLLYAGSLLPHFYFKSGIIDPWFNYYILQCFLQFIIAIRNETEKKSILPFILSGLFLGLAVLTKGPAALLIAAFSILIYFILNKKVSSLFQFQFILFVITTLFVSASWFLIEFLKGNKSIIEEFIRYQIRLFQTGDSGHDGPIYYHLVVLLIGCFPSSILFIDAFFQKNNSNDFQKISRRILLCSFWVVLILFSIVKTKIIHYSSFCYFPLSFVACTALVNNEKGISKKWIKILFWLIASLLSILFVVITFIDKIKSTLISNGWIGDTFAIENLKANGNWLGYEFFIGVIFFVSAWFFYQSHFKQTQKFVYLSLIGFILFNSLAIAVIVPKIELYTQHAAIEFYKSKANEDCYVETDTFKSYAQLFYTNCKPNCFESEKQKEYIKQSLNLMTKEGHSPFSSYSTSYGFWIQVGEIDKTAYIVGKKFRDSSIVRNKNFTKLYEKNGFNFYMRKPSSSAN